MPDCRAACYDSSIKNYTFIASVPSGSLKKIKKIAFKKQPYEITNWYNTPLSFSYRRYYMFL